MALIHSPKRKPSPPVPLYQGCTFIVAVCLGSVSLFTELRAQQPGGDAKNAQKQAPSSKRKVKTQVDTKDLPALVTKLSNDLDEVKQSVRDAAEAKLLEIGPAVVEFLPAVSSDASDEWKMRIDRLRSALEEMETEEYTLPSLLTLNGAMSGRDALTKITELTGNKIELAEVANLDREVITDFEATPFWEAFDEVLDQLELTVAAGDGGTLRLVPRALNAPLRIAAGGYSGVFRLEPLVVQKINQLHDPAQSSVQIQVLMSWEPRLVPVFVKFPMESMVLVCDDGQVLEAKLNAQETEFVPTGGSQLQVSLSFSLPTREAKSIFRWNGKVFVSIPGKLASLEFADPMKANKKTATVGNLQVVLEKARKNRDIYEVLVGVSLKSDGKSTESFRGWSNTNEAFLINQANERVEHVGWSTTRMTDSEIGLSYLFDIDQGLDGCKFVFRAPATLVEQTIEFALEDVPLP
jgi:hypothetical protein